MENTGWDLKKIRDAVIPGISSFHIKSPSFLLGLEGVEEKEEYGVLKRLYNMHLAESA